jgi:hypothetical protein
MSDDSAQLWREIRLLDARVRGTEVIVDQMRQDIPAIRDAVQRIDRAVSHGKGQGEARHEATQAIESAKRWRVGAIISVLALIATVGFNLIGG